MNSKANWVLEIDPAIYKVIRKIPRKIGERILITIQNLAINPYFGDIQKIKGEKNIWRHRVGSYRIFYETIPKEKIVYVFRIERRSSKTY